jgi:hypothetical protein
MAVWQTDRMTGPTSSTTRLLVVLDPDFGDRLRDIPLGQPAWVIMSAANEPVVRSLWTTQSAPDHLTGITGLRSDSDLCAEDRFLDELYVIDLHHGPYSTNTPYTELEVVGVDLTATIRAALAHFGFNQFTQARNGFVATCSNEEARRPRD